MTVGFSLDPPGAVGLMADTLVTYKGWSEDLPMTRYGDAVGYRSAQSLLARKLLILPGNTALAVSGEEPTIIEFLQHARTTLARVEDTKEAMRRLHAYSSDYPVKKLSFVSETLFPGGHLLNYCSKAVAKDTKNFGKIRAVGSGAGAIIKKISRYDAQRTAAASRALSNENPSRKLVGLFTTINSSILADDLNSGLGKTRNWGAYLEYGYFDTQSRSWERGPRTLQLFYRLCRAGKKGYALRQIGHAIAYEPGGSHGRLLILRGHEGELFLHEVLLQDMSTDVGVDEFRSPQGPGQAEHHPVFGSLTVGPISDAWTSWHPQMAVAAISFEAGERIVDTAFCRYGDDVAGVDFSVVPGGATFKMNAEVIEERARRFCEQKRVRYAGFDEGYHDLVPRP